MLRHALLAAACLAVTPALAQTRDLTAPANTSVATPPDTILETILETILVIGTRPPSAPLVTALEPSRDGRLATLSDLFRTAPGILVEPVFGGVDHPRLAVRGSGLQRGTMPAGRGIELRLDGLPMTFADTSFDFVEWIEPLSFGSVRTLRGGRGALAAGAALGGVIDFRGLTGEGPLALMARAEASSFGGRRGQAAFSTGDARASAYVTGGWFKQRGFRSFNAQDAWRSYANAQIALTETMRLNGSFLWSDSHLQLPGPQTLAQIAAGDRSAQPGNLGGDWQRLAERTRGTVALALDSGPTRLDLAAAYMRTDVQFRRRDVQVDTNHDWSATARLAQNIALAGNTATLALDAVWQDGQRHQQLYLNGGGTIPSFTGRSGRLWADNDLHARRLSVVASLKAPLAAGLSADLAAGFARHTRQISENLPVRPARPAATLSRRYSGFTGLALLSQQLTPGLSAFASLSHVIEPPTFDLLFINLAGAGVGAALVDGANPRRPLITPLDAQHATTAEIGLKGQRGPVTLDLTLYRSWLRGEFVSTADFVTQQVSSVGNAEHTRRWGIEAAVDARLAAPGWQHEDHLALDLRWTFTDARFAGDPVFGNRRLPILPPHVVGLGFAYDAPRGLTGALFASLVPSGGFADYAGTVQAPGYATIGGRAALKLDAVSLFIEGRNLTDKRYAATVIAAQNNLAGQDSSTFAPGEGRAVTFGVETRF
jgi:iron complex outermembrane receptor protein